MLPPVRVVLSAMYNGTHEKMFPPNALKNQHSSNGISVFRIFGSLNCFAKVSCETFFLFWLGVVMFSTVGVSSSVKSTLLYLEISSKQLTHSLIWPECRK